MLSLRYCRPARSAILRRLQSNSAATAAVELPTRHSLKQPPRVCRDPVELREATAKILETPVGGLYGGQASLEGDREDAYEVAYDTIQQVEYLQRGHSSQIPGSLYHSDGEGSLDVEISVAAMQQLLIRMEQEGQMFMQVREEKIRAQAVLDEADEVESSTPVQEDSDSGDSSSDSESDSDDEEVSEGAKDSTEDFAPPGATVNLYDALLDGMACVGDTAPIDYFNVTSRALYANELDMGTNMYTIPTHATYNAALRGIASGVYDSEPLRDDALSSAFSLYNHLTHSLHLSRNAMTMVYMFQVINQAFPPSRVRGNISVTLWDHASRIGVVNDEVLEALRQVHEPANGPEFEFFLEELSKDLPQKYRRFSKKYSHSANY